MTDTRRFMVDVGMKDLPFPMLVPSRGNDDGQATVARISVSARIMQEFEARWIDKFINVLHRHRDRIGPETVCANIVDYQTELKAGAISIEFTYPYFMERTAPVSGEPCLVQYQCRCLARLSAAGAGPVIRFGMEIPCITTYPASVPGEAGGLCGQLSTVTVEVQSKATVYPEDLVEMVDRHALAPVYSYLPAEDQAHIIRRIHTENASSVVMTDAIREELARNSGIEWYSVNTANYGMLHSYSTVVGTEKSQWVPCS